MALTSRNTTTTKNKKQQQLHLDHQDSSSSSLLNCHYDNKANSNKFVTNNYKTFCRHHYRHIIISHQKRTIVTFGGCAVLLLLSLLQLIMISPPLSYQKTSTVVTTTTPATTAPRFVSHTYDPITRTFSHHRLKLYPLTTTTNDDNNDNNNNNKNTTMNSSNNNNNRKKKKRHLIHVSKEALKAQKRLLNSKDYGSADPFIEGDCIQQYDWQLMTFPTCNNVHEYGWDLVVVTSSSSMPLELVTSGYWRDVWVMTDSDGTNIKQVLKTQRYEHDYEERNYERHRRDALASERLTSSPHVVNIYDYCANTGSFEYASRGDLHHAILSRKKKKKENEMMSGMERLKAAVDVAEGIAAVHNFDREGRASIAHTDITAGQFVLINGTYKLNDFNRCRFIRWNRKTNKPCSYEVGNNPGNLRSPEEYAYEEQSEKVDIYSMGNIFYMLLTNNYPFEDIEDSEDVYDRVMKEERPFVDDHFKNSADPVIMALLKVMTMCHVHNQTARASARDVLKVLTSAWEALRL